MSLLQFVTDEFEKQFGEKPSAILRAPGRVNLIGEHTDYNDGFVLPMAIDRAAWIALRPRKDRQVIVYSPHFRQTITFSLDEFDTAKSGWVEYVRGTAWALKEAGHTLHGWEGIVAGDVPVGAGLSSSAALELATARAFSAISGFDWDAAAMAKIGQKAENQWIGVNSGIMDQMISAAGKKDHALLIDCRSLETELVPLPHDTSVVVLDTSTRRGLEDTAYNERRKSCENAARIFGVNALRDISVAEFNQKFELLDEITCKRARHVITENDRTIRAANAMRRGDAVELGQLMQESHQSLRDDFEVSSAALNAIVACAMHETSCLGARLTGAGFGGCAVALVQTSEVESFAKRVSLEYQTSTGLKPAIYVCQATNGAEIVQSI